MPDSDSTQFSWVAPHYSKMPLLPEAEVLDTTLGGRLRKSRLQGRRILDLACGTGRWSRYALLAGAKEVVGVDLSPAMIDTANGLSVTAAEREHIKYVVADGSKPLSGPLFEESFDMVLTVCFLNYAANEMEMHSMWSVIAANLAPNGEVVGLVPNLDLDDDYSQPIDARYGTSFHKVESVNVGESDWGIKTRFVAHTGAQPVHFDMYRLNRDVYLRTARSVGIRDIQFHKMQYPESGHSLGYWDEYKRRPHYELLTARR